MAKPYWIMLLWAKRDRAECLMPPRFHPLLCHLIDVMQVCRALWEASLSPSLRTFLAGKLALDDDDACRWISFLAATHDLGKASPTFQEKWP
jgi:CRISPR-associated endonuclease/helicase Cas3